MNTESFLNDVKDHKINILLDNGVYRHIHCTKGSCNQHFDIVTYPGHLVISGDMGTFTFQRLEDMFRFFGGYGDKETHPGINTGYWEEKCVSRSRWGGVKKFDEDKLTKSIDERVDTICSDIGEYYNDWLNANNYDEDDLSEDAEYRDVDSFEAAFRAEVDDHFKYCEMGEYRFIPSIEEFESSVINKFRFDDEWEWLETESYSYQYLWCCHAIVWCIEQYNKQKAG